MVAGHAAHDGVLHRGLLLIHLGLVLAAILGLLGWIPCAHAADVVLQATVDRSLSVVTGTVKADPALGLGWVDALAALPMPTDDLTRRRTWPGPPERGTVHFEPDASEPDTLRFRALLPRRYGASGLVPRVGLFANGLWHPQPVRGETLPVLDWDATVTLPEGRLGALNNSSGTGTLHWTGRAERLSLTVLSRGHLTDVPVGDNHLVILETGPPRARWRERLAGLFQEAWPALAPTTLVVVEAPLYRRLARPGPGQLYLSDHALRLTGGLWHLHAAAVRRAMLDAALPIEDPWARALAAEAIAGEKNEVDARQMLGIFAWIPQIDEMLYDGNLPYYSEVFDEAHPVDRLHDDLAELLAPTGPPQAASRKIEARLGGGASRALAWRLLGGDSLEEAAEAIGLSPQDLADWRAPCGDVDLQLQVDPPAEPEGNWTVTVKREAPSDAPPDLVTVGIDDQLKRWDAPQGASQTSWTSPVRPERVALDPDGLNHQESRLGDTWPARWTTTLAAWIYQLDLNSGRPAGFVDVSFRRQYDTRFLWGLSLDTDAVDLASFQVYGLYYLGPLLDRRARPFRLGLALGPALLDPHYSPSETATLSLDGQIWVIHETRNDPVLPQTGHRLRVSAGGGVTPSGDAGWASLGLGGVLLTPIGGRLVLASRAGLGLAESALEHRQLGVGLSGVEPGAALGDRNGSGEFELRWQVMRNGSVPFGPVWLSDVQLSGGAEAGALRTNSGWIGATGWTAGLATVWDIFGARPTLMGVWAAQPVLWSDPALAPSRWPQAWLRFEQAF